METCTPRRSKKYEAGFSASDGSVSKRRKPNELTFEELTPAEVKEYKDWDFIMRGQEVYEIVPEHRKTRAERTPSEQRKEEQWRQEVGLESDDSEEEEYWRKNIALTGMWRNDPSSAERAHFRQMREPKPHEKPQQPEQREETQEPREKPQEPHGSDDFSSAGAQAKQEEPQAKTEEQESVDEWMAFLTQEPEENQDAPQLEQQEAQQDSQSAPKGLVDPLPEQP